MIATNDNEEEDEEWAGASIGTVVHWKYSTIDDDHKRTIEWYATTFTILGRRPVHSLFIWCCLLDT